MNRAKILLVDDDPALLDSFALRLSLDYEVAAVQSPEEAMTKIQESLPPFDVAVVDMWMNDDPQAGLKLIEQIRNHISSPPECVALTAYGKIENASECMEKGAFGYVEKGRETTNKLLEQTINKASGFCRLKREQQSKAVLSAMSEALVRIVESHDSFAYQDSEHRFSIPGTDIILRPTYAQHHETIASGYSIGLLVDLYSTQGKEATIGFTSDTAWTPQIHKQYEQCNLLVMHIGTVNEKELTHYKTYPKHLGALGVSRLIGDMRDDCKLYLFSEFNEEFRETRREIMTTIKNASQSSQRCVIADIGTKVGLPHMKLMCEYTECKEQAEPEDVFDYYGIVRHYCKKHKPYKSRWIQFE